MIFWSPRSHHLGTNDNSSQNKDTACVKLNLWYMVVVYIKFVLIVGQIVERVSQRAME